MSRYMAEPRQSFILPRLQLQHFCPGPGDNFRYLGHSKKNPDDDDDDDNDDDDDDDDAQK